MKNVLIIASLYGSKRVLSLAKYLPEYGWQPTIVTPPVDWYPTIITPESREIPELPYEVIVAGDHLSNGMLKILNVNTKEEARTKIKHLLNMNTHHTWVDSMFTIGGAFLNYPDPHKEWKPYAIKEAMNQVNTRDVDCILSICPIISHIAASTVKEKTGVYWVADYTDLWSQSLNYSYGYIRQAMDRRLEKKTFRNVDSIISCSEQWVERISKLHEDKPVNAITLGYDPEEYTGSSWVISRKFTITYTGLIYQEKQDPSNFLIAVSDLVNAGQMKRDDIDIRFYGQHLDWLDGEFEKLGIADIAHQLRLIPHNKIVRIQQRSQVLLLLDWNDPKEFGAYSSKVFEYLGARRPILAVGGYPGNTISRLMEETKAGVHYQTVDEIKQVLMDYYRDYKKTGHLQYSGIEQEIVKYSNKLMAEKYSVILSGGNLK